MQAELKINHLNCKIIIPNEHEFDSAFHTWYVLIRAPFCVPLKRICLARMFDTFDTVPSSPKLPMLSPMKNQQKILKL